MTTRRSGLLAISETLGVVSDARMVALAELDAMLFGAVRSTIRARFISMVEGQMTERAIVGTLLCLLQLAGGTDD